jgi:GT2 family glycosyltransferase
MSCVPIPGVSLPAPRVACVVVTYNGRELVLQALASLRRMSYARFDLFAVDNGSTDGSEAAIRAAFPEVGVWRRQDNRGSASGYAHGLERAIAQGYDYVLLLNNDIEVRPDLLDHLVRVAESDGAIGCVGPKCYYFSDRERLWSAGGILRFRESVTRERGTQELDRGQYDRDEEVPYINGCAILIRTSAALAVGNWDPLYFVCVDDADFCTRLRRAGFRCFFAHRAVLYHMVAVSTGGYTAARNFELGRSSALYVRRYARPGQFAAFLLFSALALPWAWLRELRRGNQAAATAKWRGLRAGLSAPLPAPPGFAALPIAGVPESAP